MVDYIPCLVCGRMTPTDRGYCYHCQAPLPTRITLPRGFVVCMNCLRVTPADTGFCRKCRAPFPPDTVEWSRKNLYRVEYGADLSRLWIGPGHASFLVPRTIERGNGDGGDIE